MGGRGTGSGFRAGGNNPQATKRNWMQGTVNQRSLARFTANLANDIATHSSQQNDSAERRMEYYIAREEEVARNFDTYIATGYIASPDAPRWQSHQESLGTLKAQLAAFRAERRRQGR